MSYNSTDKKYFVVNPNFMNGVRTPTHLLMCEFIMTLLFRLFTKKHTLNYMMVDKYQTKF
jgi:hypothetical protein